MAREKNPAANPAAKRTPRRRSTDAGTDTPLETPSFVDPQQRSGLIARAAYFRAMDRGFEPGNELADWLAAEAEVDAELLRGTVESTSA
jgi:hypothetical protein